MYEWHVMAILQYKTPHSLHRETPNILVRTLLACWWIHNEILSASSLAWLALGVIKECVDAYFKLSFDDLNKWLFNTGVNLHFRCGKYIKMRGSALIVIWRSPFYMIRKLTGHNLLTILIKSENCSWKFLLGWNRDCKVVELITIF